jgi:hypothetical protein
MSPGMHGIRDGAEVDPLIEQGGRFIAVEAKFGENPGQADLKGFQAFESFYGEKGMISGWLACRILEISEGRKELGFYLIP